MAESRRAKHISEERPKAARIDGKSTTYRWLIPAALILVGIVTVLLIAASVAIIFDILPRG